jgi:MscS family membrane protein
MNIRMIDIRSNVVFLIIVLLVFSPGLCFAAETLSDTEKTIEKFESETQALFTLKETPISEKTIAEVISKGQWWVNTYPLIPANTSSPRATLKAFLRTMKGTHSLLMMAHQKNLTEPGLFASEQVLQLGKFAEKFFQRGMWCLNLRKVPKAHKQDVGWEAAIKLKEILDRIELPPFDQIPDDQAIEAEEESEKTIELHRWRLPNTDIIIARVDEGPRQGEYLIAPETVALMDEFYNQVKDLAYKEDPRVSPGFLEFFRSTPGRLLPPKWSQWLPSWSYTLYYGGAIWQWGAMAALLLVTLVAIWLLFRWWLRRSAGFPSMTRLWGWSFLILVATVTLVLVSQVLDEQVNITGSVDRVLGVILQTIFWLLLAAAAILAANAVAETITASPKIDPEGIHASLIRAFIGFIGVSGAVVIIFYGLSSLGVSLIPLLTGLGVGGLAIALAARPTLENIIGGFMILADRPYRVGQLVKAQGYYGWVEKIGLRSTRIRLRSGPQTVIPNEVMARVDIENVGRRPYIRRTSNITITYDTPPEKVEKAIKIIEDIIDNHEGMDPEFPPWVYFNEFNADSLNIMMRYWFHPPDLEAAYAFDQKVNLAIMQEFEKEGIEFAFPTTTTYLTQEDEQPLSIRIADDFKPAS